MCIRYVGNGGQWKAAKIDVLISPAQQERPKLCRKGNITMWIWIMWNCNQQCPVFFWISMWLQIFSYCLFVCVCVVETCSEAVICWLSLFTQSTQYKPCNYQHKIPIHHHGDGKHISEHQITFNHFLFSIFFPCPIAPLCWIWNDNAHLFHRDELWVIGPLCSPSTFRFAI